MQAAIPERLSIGALQKAITSRKIESRSLLERSNSSSILFPMTPKTPTLADVGRAAGVSRGTVSNVFNSPEMVRADVRARVEAAARALNYDGPDARGRILRGGKFNAVGFMPSGSYSIAEMMRSPYGRELLLGLAIACDAAAATLSLVNGAYASRSLTLKDALVDGFVLGHTNDIDLITSAQRRRLPFVLLDSDAGTEVNSIRIDGRRGALMATRHLTALGHRKFVILAVRRSVGPPIFHPPGPGERAVTTGYALDADRLQGFAQGLAEASLSITDMPIIETTPGDPTAGAIVFDRAPEATAILTMSDWQAITLLKEAANRGVRVPEDISVVGFDGTAEGAKTTPPLTTILHDIVGKGRRAIEMVLSNQPPQQILLPVDLVVRGTTARPAKP